MPSESYPNQKHYSGSNQDDKFEGHDPSNNPFSFKHPWDDAMFLNYSDKEKHAIKNATGPNNLWKAFDERLNSPNALDFERNARSENLRVNHPQSGNYVSSQHQSDVGNMLNQQRRQENSASGSGQAQSVSPNVQNLAKEAAKSPQSAGKKAAKLVFSVFRQIRAQDWPYLCLLLPLSLLKDIFDIAFAAIPGVGIVISFIGTVLLTIFTAVCLILIGEKVMSRKSGKYIAGLSVEFITEALPAIGWLPLAFIETLVIYGFVLCDRAAAPQPEGAEASA
ncbi:MAG: hypothetical protein A2359_02720 [Candidatus Moranbacteria bacterium RIFOXYB1_FULL_43_19]|nr:MAG: hypothetical protein A2359_02720 [Candidatus Moranbacteria bacterium RIFOXYB1_FULL_43_19]OGI28850.1 MAG: hypothetical protein A2184_00615 [Candidatus Moranbacteria bacterium RIFOXYA1_FULL_44_7]OGI33948.1 MAG: hypothetical protein A2420_03570 [Candidatus Moranbacteria bacterium RIFOXYC1_FULL_44_13]OGI37295.1 MAG: hypothetical protein A2612_04875 [Candidatus Moranbacteria bacterium RIFOXYD1_FULL_44_12]